MDRFDILEQWDAIVHVKKKVLEVTFWRFPRGGMPKRICLKRFKRNNDMTAGDLSWMVCRHLQELIDKAHPVPKDWEPTFSEDEEGCYPSDPPYPRIVWQFVVDGVR